MDASPEIRVTLSDELMKHLRLESQVRQVPLQWLVAGLVCDTLEAQKHSCHMSRKARVAGYKGSTSRSARACEAAAAMSA
jgi:hypothetical protein